MKASVSKVEGGSTSAEVLSMGLPIPDTMGRPGGYCCSLCVFGSRSVIEKVSKRCVTMTSTQWLIAQIVLTIFSGYSACVGVKQTLNWPQCCRPCLTVAFVFSSPASGACSTDSAGSSLSIDDGDGWGDIGPDGSSALGRYGHSLTPDEPVILEENCDECLSWTNAAGRDCDTGLDWSPGGGGGGKKRCLQEPLVMVESPRSCMWYLRRWQIVVSSAVVEEVLSFRLENLPAVVAHPDGYPALKKVVEEQRLRGIGHASPFILIPDQRCCPPVAHYGTTVTFAGGSRQLGQQYNLAAGGWWRNIFWASLLKQYKIGSHTVQGVRERETEEGEGEGHYPGDTSQMQCAPAGQEVMSSAYRTGSTHTHKRCCACQSINRPDPDSLLTLKKDASTVKMGLCRMAHPCALGMRTLHFDFTHLRVPSLIWASHTAARVIDTELTEKLVPRVAAGWQHPTYKVATAARASVPSQEGGSDPDLTVRTRPELIYSRVLTTRAGVIALKVSGIRCVVFSPLPAGFDPRNTGLSVIPCFSSSLSKAGHKRHWISPSDSGTLLPLYLNRAPLLVLLRLTTCVVNCVVTVLLTGEKCGNYMPMDRSATCLSLPIHPITTISNSVSGSGPQRKFSPNLSSGFKSASPSQVSFVVSAMGTEFQLCFDMHVVHRKKAATWQSTVYTLGVLSSGSPDCIAWVFAILAVFFLARLVACNLETSYMYTATHLQQSYFQSLRIKRKIKIGYYYLEDLVGIREVKAQSSGVVRPGSGSVCWPETNCRFLVAAGSLSCILAPSLGPLWNYEALGCSLAAWYDRHVLSYTPCVVGEEGDSYLATSITLSHRTLSVWLARCVTAAYGGSSYMEMYSPCSSSPMDPPGGYMAMSPGRQRWCSILSFWPAYAGIMKEFVAVGAFYPSRAMDWAVGMATLYIRYVGFGVRVLAGDGIDLCVDMPLGGTNYVDTVMNVPQTSLFICGCSSLGGHFSTSQKPIGMLADGVRTMSYSRNTNSANHSRGSSLAEETPDGYVPMAPGVMDDGYVDMDPILPGHHRHLNDGKINYKSFMCCSLLVEGLLKSTFGKCELGLIPDRVAPGFSHVGILAGYAADFHHGEMSPASSCSITSGTPSTDLRFSEYHLEKVSSYFTPSEEDETSSLDRPIRAYSVGSRPDIKKMNRLEICNQADAARVRAFSVGSRTGTGGKLTASRLLSHDLHSRYHTSSAGPTLTPPTHHQLQSTPSSYGKKSLSAPLLSNSWSGSSNFRHAHTNSSHSSIEPMDDLMEMDFSHHRNTRSNKTSGSSSKTSVKSKLDASLPPSGSLSNHDRSSTIHGGCSGSNGDAPRSLVKLSAFAGPYLEMKPSISVDSHVTLSPGAKSTTISPKTSVSSGPCEEMKGGVISGELLMNNLPSNIGQEAASSPPKRATPGTSPKSSFIGSETSQLPFSSPKSIVGSGVGHAADVDSAGPYLEMKPRGDPGGTHTQSFATIVKHLSSRKPTSPIQEEYMDMSLGRQPLEEENDVNCPLSNRTGPVDTPQTKKQHDTSWSVGPNKPPTKSSLEGLRSQMHSEDDYMTVNYDGRGNRKKERKGSRKDRRDKTRYSSQPIAIQSSSLPKDPVVKTTSSTSPVFSFSNLVSISGRKHSSGTPPKIPPGFLPLDGSGYSGSSPGSSPFSSLRRQRHGKRSNGGSKKEMSDVNSGVTTPTGSNVAIFPFSLNSPSSPMKPFPGPSIHGKVQNLDSSFESSSKCPVDATSGTVRISYPYSDIQQPVISPDSGAMTSESSSSSEQPTPVNLAACPDNEYVNYSPKQPSVKNEYDSYTVMHPIPVASSNMMRKISAPLFGVSHVQHGLANLAMSSPSLTEGKVEMSRQSMLGFQPIGTPAEQMPPPKVITSCQSPSYQGTARFSKPLSSGKESSETAGNKVEVQAEEKVKEGTTSNENSVSSSRPPSVISERELHYASLDLASTGGKDGDDGSCSPHGIKSQSSLTESSTSSSSPNPSIAGGAGGETFTYAEIDFVKKFLDIIETHASLDFYSSERNSAVRYLSSQNIYVCGMVRDWLATSPCTSDKRGSGNLATSVSHFGSWPLYSTGHVGRLSDWDKILNHTCKIVITGTLPYWMAGWLAHVVGEFWDSVRRGLVVVQYTVSSSRYTKQNSPMYAVSTSADMSRWKVEVRKARLLTG
ncbi:hypothetical protein PR048_007334, partial [Dryococelus australis]